MERQLAQLDTLDARRSAQIARGDLSGIEALQTVIEVKHATAFGPAVYKTWNDAIEFKRRQIRFRLTRVGLLLDELTAAKLCLEKAEKKGSRYAIKEARNALKKVFNGLRGLRICPGCEAYPQDFGSDECNVCGASLKRSELPPSSEAEEPGDGTGLPLVTQTRLEESRQTWRRIAIEEAQRRQREPGVSIRWRPNGEEFAEILETNS